MPKPVPVSPVAEPGFEPASCSCQLPTLYPSSHTDFLVVVGRGVQWKKDGEGERMAGIAEQGSCLELRVVSELSLDGPWGVVGDSPSFGAPGYCRHSLSAVPGLFSHVFRQSQGSGMVCHSQTCLSLVHRAWQHQGNPGL